MLTVGRVDASREKRRNRVRVAFLIVLSVLCIDTGLKLWVHATDARFGLNDEPFSTREWLLVALAAALFVRSLCSLRATLLLTSAYALCLGGVLANGVELVVMGHVTDFIAVRRGQLWSPGDIAIYLSLPPLAVGAVIDLFVSDRKPDA